jgi:hypothetical protein
MNNRAARMSNGHIEWAAFPRRSLPMNSNYNNPQREENICIHIFSVSAAMVGVCLTVIGLIRVVISFGRADTLADDLLAGDAFLFLIACFCSYAALRANSLEKMKKVERTADWTFIAAMSLMVVVCAFITYAISIPPLAK